MTKILVLGANGQLARNTTKALLTSSDAELTLYLRQARRIPNPAPDRVRIVEGDVNDQTVLQSAMKGQDVVYANLSGDMARQAKSIVEAMHATGVRRLIFISSMGIYGEVPGEKYQSILDPYRDSAAVIEGSNLEYTVVRPGWFRRGPGGQYRITRKGEAFVGHDIALDSLSALIGKLATTPGLHLRESIGVSDA